MKARNAQTLVKVLSLGAATAVVLTGCGGSGAAGGSNFATSFATSYSMTAIDAPADGSGLQLRLVSRNGKMGGFYMLTGGNKACFSVVNGVAVRQTPTDKYCNPLAISNDGTIDGYVTSSSNLSIPFTTHGGSFQEIALPTGEDEGEVECRDSAGNAYVNCWDSSYKLTAYRYDGTTMTPITVPGMDETWVLAVAPGGMALVMGRTGGTKTYAWLMPNATAGTPLDWSPAFGSVSSVNDDQTIVGSKQVGASTLAYYAVDGQEYTVSPFSGSTYYAVLASVSKGNLAVGQDDHGQASAVAWSKNDGAIDLSTRIQSVTGQSFSFAFGVSDSGVIVGQGVDASGGCGMVLTPAN
ncbi:MAG: hypothetical protein JST51_20120 [Armatimonadetes bacterium]|nr:hypothetical protein [Armatimonadota bacterium]